MRRLIAVAVVFTLLGLVFGFFLSRGSPTALAGVAKCTAQNGDANADGKIDLADPITILGHLFLGSPTELAPLCATPVPAGLLATGQTECYDEDGHVIPCDGTTCPGQDQFYKTGCPTEGRFVENGDGTVTDHCTGLMWQQDTADVSANGEITDRDAIRWCFALSFCENLTFAGYDDWRLPNVRELQSLVDYGRFVPSIDPNFSALTESYWSSTSLFGNAFDAWTVNFLSGEVTLDSGKVHVGYIRAVRNAP